MDRKPSKIPTQQSYPDESPYSSLRFHSSHRSDLGDPPDSPTESHPTRNSVDNFTWCSPALSPLPPLASNKADTPEEVAVAVAVMASVTKSEGTPSSSSVRKVRGSPVASTLRRSKREVLMKVGELGVRIAGIVFSLISFSVLAADKTQGWSGNNFNRYKEYRYCLSVNVIAFVYSAFQAYDLGYYISTGKHVIRHHFRRHFNSLIDQILAYLLLSASSSAATRVGDWQSNWGKDQFTEMASASIAMSFLAFVAFAASSIISGHNLCNYDAI